MKTARSFLVTLVIGAVFLTGCNNYFHELMPPNENRILSFSVLGQVGREIISDNSISAVIDGGTELISMIPKIKISPKAILLPLTIEYLQEAFPQANFFKVAMDLYSVQDLSSFVLDLIKENPDFNIPAINIPIDFSGPVNFIVISGQGNIRQYSVNIEIDEGLPRLISFVFSKYDNPELIRDAYSPVNENTRTVNTSVLYPMEIELSYALIPVFEILGDKIIVDGNEIRSGFDAVQFNKTIGVQEKIITVWRDDKHLDFTLTAVFSEDPDSIRSITDFRFNKSDNPSISINAVASIVNNDALGVINAQVFYSGSRPSQLVPRFISPGIVSVTGVTQITGNSPQDFSSTLEYKVVSRNNLYVRTYTVNVDYIDIQSASPVISSFKLSSRLNHELVTDTTAQIIDGSGQIIIDAAYAGLYPPETLTPEFSATGLVTVYNAVQVSGFSSQNFSRQVKYTVTNPENSLFTRDYYVQVRFTRDTSSDVAMKSFSFHPDDNPSLDDEITGRIDHNLGKITLYAPTGSGVSTRTMMPRFTAAGQVLVNGTAQTSGVSGQLFSSPIVYETVSANGNNRREYTVTVRELLSTIYVDCNAEGMGDGSSWRDAFRSLKEACEAASHFNEDVPKEIWIAKGTYKPGANSNDYFLLTANTNYIGGFAGGETAKSQRNVSANTVTISGDLGAGAYTRQLFGAFNGESSKTVNGDVAFEDIEFRSSRANGSRNTGSAINSVQSNGSYFSITNCSFDDFKSAGSGGALYVFGSSIDINGSVFTNCTSSDTGGVIYAQSSHVIVNDSDFTNNSSSISAGGVLYFSGTEKVELSNVKINSAANGGAVYNIGNNLAIINSEIKDITGTYAVYSSGGLEAVNLELHDIMGQGINVTSGILYLSNLSAFNISGRSVYFSSSSRAIVENSTFDKCGDVYVYDASSVQIKDIEITNVISGTSGLYARSGSNGNIDIDKIKIENVAIGRGMEISTAGNVIISNANIKHTKTTGNGCGINFSSGAGNAVLLGITIENAEGAGAIYSAAKNITLNNSEIKTITGAYGIYSAGGLSVNGVTLRDITGQGIYVTGGALNLSTVTATDLGSNAVYFSSTANRAVIENSTFNRCGSVHLDYSSSVEITNLEITNVISGASGLYARSSGNIDIDKIKIENVPNGRGMEINTARTVIIFDAGIRNTKTSGNGGGILLSGSGNAILSDVTIYNTSANSGGGIYSSNRLDISNSTIRKADANQNGGGLWISMYVSLSINDTLFEDCIAYNDGGAIYKIFAIAESGVITNSNFIDCTSGNRGKIIYYGSAQGSTSIIEVKYCTFTHTSALRYAGEFDNRSYYGMFLACGYYEACTFNNLTSNTIHEYYLFGNRFKTIDDGNTSLIGGQYIITLKDCIFNFKNTGKLGLIAVHNRNEYNGNTFEVNMIIDNITVNNYNGLQPLIWLYRYSSSYPSDVFKFARNNVYNGTLLDTQQKIINLGPNIIRLEDGAVPTMVP